MSWTVQYLPGVMDWINSLEIAKNMPSIKDPRSANTLYKFLLNAKRMKNTLKTAVKANNPKWPRDFLTI